MYHFFDFFTPKLTKRCAGRYIKPIFGFQNVSCEKIRMDKSIFSVFAGLLSVGLLIIGSAGAELLYVNKYAGICNDTGIPEIPFCTIQAAIDAVAPGGTVSVSGGSYIQNQILINKSVTVQGSGIGISVIDGQVAATLSGEGLVRIIAPGNVTFSGFTIQNAGVDPSITKDGMQVTAGIYANSTSTSATYTIFNNKIFGTGDAEEEKDYGLYAYGGQESLVFSNNIITETAGNAVLIEKHAGPTLISENTLDEGTYGSTAIVYMTYGGTDIVTPQIVNHNSIDVGTGNFDHSDSNWTSGGITFRSSFGGSVAGDGKYSNVQIANNTITDMWDYRSGITLSNDAAGDGIAGEISSPVINGNFIQGKYKSGSIGIQLLGRVSNADVENNQMDKLENGFYGDASPNDGATHYPTNAVFHNNLLTNDTVALVWGGEENFNASYNYWDSQNPDFATLISNASASVITPPWYIDSGMTMRISKAPAGNQTIADQEEVIVNPNSTEIIVPDGSPVHKVSIPDTVPGDTPVTLDLSQLKTTTGAGEEVTLTNDMTLSRNTSSIGYSVGIPSGTTVSGPAGWTGVINVLTVKATTSVTPPTGIHVITSVATVVEVGYGDTKLTFNKAVRLLISGQAGSLAGYSRGGNFYQITDVCPDDDQANNTARLVSEGDCKIDVGSDLVIWTKHFTNFVAYSQSPIPGSSHCTPNLVCSGWSACSANGEHTRICTDSTGCELGSVMQTQSCVYTPTPPVTPTTPAQPSQPPIPSPPSAPSAPSAPAAPGVSDAIVGAPTGLAAGLAGIVIFVAFLQSILYLLMRRKKYHKGI